MTQAYVPFPNKQIINGHQIWLTGKQYIFKTFKDYIFSLYLWRVYKVGHKILLQRMRISGLTCLSICKNQCWSAAAIMFLEPLYTLCHFHLLAIYTAIFFIALLCSFIRLSLLWLATSRFARWKLGLVIEFLNRHHHGYPARSHLVFPFCCPFLDTWRKWKTSSRKLQKWQTENSQLKPGLFILRDFPQSRRKQVMADCICKELPTWRLHKEFSEVLVSCSAKRNGNAILLNFVESRSGSSIRYMHTRCKHRIT